MEDARLSFRALGVLVYLLSKPDHWTVDSRVLCQTHPEGRDAVRTALSELKEAGYMRQERVLVGGPGGVWKTETVIYDISDPHTGKSAIYDIDDPGVGKTGPGAGNLGTGYSGTGRPGTKVSTDKQLLIASTSTTPAQKSGSRPAAPKTRKLVLADPDGSTSVDEEPAALGGDRKPRTLPERKEIARQRGCSGLGLAMRLKNGLLEAGVKGTTNVSAVTVRMTEQRQAGYTWTELNAMVDTFIAAPARYTFGSTAPWKAFLNSIQKLADDNAKVTSVAPSAYADDPYAGMED